MITNDAAKASESKEIQRLKVGTLCRVLFVCGEVQCALPIALCCCCCCFCDDSTYRTSSRSSKPVKLWKKITEGFGADHLATPLFIRGEQPRALDRMNRRSLLLQLCA
jgi:hypothetical protein